MENHTKIRPKIFISLQGFLLILLFSLSAGIIRNLCFPEGIPLLNPEMVIGRRETDDIPNAKEKDSALENRSDDALAGSRTHSITIEELLRMLRKDETGLLLIDARDPDEFFEGHIPKAINLPFMDFEEFFPGLEDIIASAGAIVVYCSGASCSLAERLSGLLGKITDVEIMIFPGGMEEWTDRDLPVEEG